MKPVVIYLPWPPTVNSYYGHARSGVYISSKGRVFRQAVEDSVIEQSARLLLDEHLHVTVSLHPPDRRPRDLDNYMKALFDACTIAGVWEDDKLIDQMEVYRGEVIKKGAVILEINEAGPVLPWKRI